MTELKYTFLPYLRQGLGSLISDTDNMANGTAINQARAKVKVKLKAKGTKVSNGQDELLEFGQGQTVLEKEIEIYGPGDIVGMNKDAVVRTDPTDWVTNFEPNYLPYIEFWDEDFPWRYTPLAPAQSGNTSRLRPWISLVVLKDDEFVKVSEFNGILPTFKINNKAYQDIFPDEKNIWAWANVHVNSELSGTVATALGNLNTQLQGNPALAVSRIICPRRLEENMGYTCFLIPSFEMGRCAGLGITSTTTNMQLPSWAWNGANNVNTEFPYYYEWYFKTGTKGDFESLAGLLAPTVIDPKLMGFRLIDLQDPGHSSFEGLTPTPPDTELVSGALRPQMTAAPNDDWWNPPVDTDPSAYKSSLKDLLSLSTEYLANGSTGDPVITPPMYGRWHAKVNLLDTAKTDWLNKVNLDPKFRIMASSGAEVVRKNQEFFMQIAWEQVKDVEEANRLMNQLLLGMESSQATFDKSFVNTSDESKLLMSCNVHARLIGSNNDTVYQNTKDSVIPDGCFTGSFVKASRSNAFLVNNFSGTVALDTSSLISNLNSGSIQVCSAYTAPAGQNTYNILAPFQLSSSFTISQPPRPTFSLTVPSMTYFPPGNGGMSSAMAMSFMNAATSTHNYIGPVKTPVASNPPLDLSVAAQTVTDGIEPNTSILSRASGMLNVVSAGGQAVPINNVSPIMACPKLEMPMFDYLYDLSPDLIMPNLNQLPQNSVSLMELNRDMVEAYMLGLNHEMASELLWREYPTDQRGTVFSRFFGATVESGTTGTAYDNTRFVKPIHTWKSGSNLSNLGVNQPATFNPANLLILSIRGELLKKYPNTIVYAQKAKWQQTSGNDDSSKARVPTGLEADTLKPMFYSQAGDIAFFGFDLDKTEAKGSTFTDNLANDMNEPGWFFILKEMIGEVHYGLDEVLSFENPYMDRQGLVEWDALNWGHMCEDQQDTINDIRFVRTNVSFNPLQPPDPTVYAWDRNAADFSAILLRKPAYICIHSKELLS